MPRQRAPALRLCRRLPLQQPPFRHQHPPQRRRYRRQGYPRLIWQQPQPYEGLHYRAAHAGQYARVAPYPPAAAAGHAALRQRQKKPCQQGKQRRPRRHAQPASGQKEASRDGRQRRRGDKTAAQAVYQPPPVDVAQSAREYEGNVLPVAAYPAVLALIVCKRLCRKAIRKLRVAHVCAAQIRALRRVVAEYPPLREAPRALQQGARVYHALPGEAAA